MKRAAAAPFGKCKVYLGSTWNTGLFVKYILLLHYESYMFYNELCTNINKQRPLDSTEIIVGRARPQHLLAGLGRAGEGLVVLIAERAKAVLVRQAEGLGRLYRVKSIRSCK